MLTNHNAYKYETPYKGSFVISYCFSNVAVNLQFDAVQIRYNMCFIKPYKSNTKVDGFSSKNIPDNVDI